MYIFCILHYVVFYIFLQHSLWANKVDLSLSVGNRVDIISNPLKVVDELDKLILADDSKEMWIQLSESLKVKDLVIGKLTINLVIVTFVIIL